MTWLDSLPHWVSFHSLVATMLVLLIITAFSIITFRDLLGSVIMLSIFSLLMAVLYLILDAPDVALTEASVGALMGTFLFLAALSFTKRQHRKTSRARRFMPMVIVIVAGAALAYAALDLPAFGTLNAPIHNHVAPYYLENTRQDIGVNNYVTAILGSYRGFDTLGEVGVIFTAGIAIAALLMNVPQKRLTQEMPIIPSSKSFFGPKKPQRRRSSDTSQGAKPVADKKNKDAP